MMTTDQPSDLAGRVAALETALAEQSRLRADVDSDLSDVQSTLRAHGHLLQALHITQSQHTEALARLDGKIDELSTGVGRIIVLLDTLIDREG